MPGLFGDGGHAGLGGTCRAASCCRSRGYPDCRGCDERTSCGKPEEAEKTRCRWTAEEGERRNRWREGMARRAPVLAQWLPVLFWLLLCGEVVNLLDQRLNPGGIWDGISTVVSVGLAIGLLVVFWKLSPCPAGSERYGGLSWPFRSPAWES